jgi:hypothetical protein
MMKNHQCSLTTLECAFDPVQLRINNFVGQTTKKLRQSHLYMAATESAPTV